MTTNAQFSLTNNQIDAINNLTHNGTQDFYKAYDFIYGIIKNQSSVNADVKTWFQRASEINRNDQLSAANNFIRSVSADGLALDGKTANLDITTGLIGAKVIQDINNLGGIPTITRLIQSDIDPALNQGGQTIGGWGGAFYYWDEPYGDTDHNGVRPVV